MVEAEIINSFVAIIGLFVVGGLGYKLISGVIGVKKTKQGLVTPEDFKAYKNVRDDADGVLKATINRMRSQAGADKARAGQVVNNVADSLKEGADEADIGEAIEDLIGGLPDTWQNVINPVKSGVITAIKEQEVKEPGSFLKKVESMKSRLEKSKTGSKDSNSQDLPGDYI